MKFDGRLISAPLVIATSSSNAAIVVDVLAEVERDGGSRTPTRCCIAAIIRRKPLDGVGVDADHEGSTNAATTTPSAFPPPLAATASNVGVAAKRVARVNSGTPTLPVDGRWGTVVDVGVKTECKTDFATPTPVHLRLSIARFAMAARIDDKVTK